MLPMLKTFVNSGNSNKDAMWSLLLLLLFAFILPLISGTTHTKIAFYIPMHYTIFYVMLGHFMSRLSSRHLLLDLAVIVGIGLLFIVSRSSGWDCAAALSSYSSLLTALMAAAVYDLFRHIRHVPWPRALPILWRIDRLCFCVYLIHPVVIYTFYRIVGITPTTMADVLNILFVFVLVSFFIAWLLSKVPLLGKLIS